jgi:hypothetical protein
LISLWRSISGDSSGMPNPVRLIVLAALRPTTSRS